MRLQKSLLLFVVIAVSAFAQNPKPVADRLAAQNALFEEQYESAYWLLTVGMLIGLGAFEIRTNRN